VEFRVLGPVEVRVAGQPIDVGHARQRSVLAVLLLDLGRVVPTERLIDRVWGDSPPAAVRNVLYGYVARLRAAIARAGDAQVTLARRAGGYLIEASRDQVDLYSFRDQVAAADAATGDDERAALLRGALGLWSGPALAGLSSPWLSGMRETLEVQRIATALDLNDIALRQGKHSALVSELAQEAAAHPDDERLIGQLMLALYRSGRPTEALRWFERTSQRLSVELGADPGPELQKLHQQILRTDPSLAPPEPAPAESASPRTAPVPRELPADVPAFTGRTSELAELDGLLAMRDNAAGAAADDGGPARTRPLTEARAAAMLISAVAGTGGVGKTALAVRWAHRVAGLFPDGQLYVNLRGYDPDQPMPAAEALARFLRALGVPGQDIPPEEAERAARYRSLLAGKRMLVVLDNAGSVEQVRSLLPGAAACVVVVTSRDALAGLVARDGARRIDLDLLPSADAVGLLRELIGDRVDADHTAAIALAAQCARLPLALRVAAELAVALPGASLAGLAGELADQQRRLDLLDADGDPRTAVRAVFSWSYRHLDAATARMFRLAGLHPGPDLDPYAAAALAGTTVPQASHLLDLLDRAHLIQRAGPDRYGLHDLLRAYARELAATQDGQEEQQQALTRLFDHYLHTAAAAMDTLFPTEQYRRPRIPAPASPVPPTGDATMALGWLDGERASLVTTARMAEAGWPGHATRLAATLHRYLDEGGHYPEAITVHTCARRAARHAGDHAGEATALASLAAFEGRQGRYEQATDHLQQALILYRQTADQAGEARALGNLGGVELWHGRLQQAAGHYQQALVLFRATGDRTGEAIALGNLGHLDTAQGRYDRAADHLQQAVALCRETGYQTGEAQALGNLGNVHARQGRYSEAADHHQQALALFRATGNRTGEAQALADMGGLFLRQEHHEQAASHFEQARARCRDMGNRVGEVDALNGLGDVALSLGQPGRARSRYAAALGLASQSGIKSLEALAHRGLGAAYHADGDPGQARHHWQAALSLYTELDAPEADQVRVRLAAEASHDRRPKGTA
jgi:DNA-binding SARP family transcriptional activator